MSFTIPGRVGTGKPAKDSQFFVSKRTPLPRAFHLKTSETLAGCRNSPGWSMPPLSAITIQAHTGLTVTARHRNRDGC